MILCSVCGRDALARREKHERVRHPQDGHDLGWERLTVSFIHGPGELCVMHPGSLSSRVAQLVMSVPLPPPPRPTEVVGYL